MQTITGMDSMQISVNTPVNGQLVARSGSQLLWSAPIKSRPVRRALFPLEAISKSASDSDIELTIEA
ncbi:hypothetical protein [uncultured Cohaesibacter sp.]|uniref:hypothetical protein n=1 Tax=uncultured Cohaesibacter sp. TaxID=1002546 RepID=UPI0029C67148|nr:hypothetical protein [uncultured Cohaesibacter sp.]